MKLEIGKEYMNSAYIGYFVYLGELNYPDIDFGGMVKIPAFLHYCDEYDPRVIRWGDGYSRELDPKGFRPRIRVSG